MNAIKWGILAPGTIAHRFAQGLAQIPGAIPHAVGSRDLGRAQAFATEYGFKHAYGSYEELVADPEVDAIYVANPHPFHEQATLLCLKAGKAVLVEKPFAANLAQAQHMVDMARANKVFLMEAMWTRFLPAMVKAKQLIEEGAIGEVRHIAVDFGFRADIDPEGRLFAPALAGGSLLDVGVYTLSFCSLVMGQAPERIQAHLHIGSTGVDEEAQALLSYPGGASASVYSAIRVDSTSEAQVFGTKGSLRLPQFWHTQTFTLKNEAGEQRFDLPYAASGFQFQAMEVMDCLSRGLSESPRMPLDESLAIMAQMDQMRAQGGLRYPFE